MNPGKTYFPVASMTSVAGGSVRGSIARSMRVIVSPSQ